MTWDVHNAGSWGVATTDTPADMAAALARPGSWPIDKRRCFVRRDQWPNLAPVNPLPVLTSLNPASVTEWQTGDPPTITVAAVGSGFTPVSAIQSAGGDVVALGPTTYVSPTRLEVHPNIVGLAGNSTTVLRVVTPPPGGGTSASQIFTVTPAAQDPVPPALSSIEPTSGPAAGGTAVTVRGSKLTGSTGVAVANTVCGGFTVVDDSTATATTPPGAVGARNVQMRSPAGNGNTLSGGFTYV